MVNEMNHLKKEENKTMNKTQLVEAVALKADLKKKDAEAAVTAVFAAIENALVSGDKVQVVGFGTLEVKATAAKVGINPQTKAKIQIPAKKAVKFSAGKALKDKVNA
jgi:DNA-binding protein HU-beta